MSDRYEELARERMKRRTNGGHAIRRIGNERSGYGFESACDGSDCHQENCSYPDTLAEEAAFLRRVAEEAQTKLDEETKAQDEALALLHKQIEDAFSELASAREQVWAVQAMSKQWKALDQWRRWPASKHEQTRRQLHQTREQVRRLREAFHELRGPIGALTYVTPPKPELRLQWCDTATKIIDAALAETAQEVNTGSVT